MRSPVRSYLDPAQECHDPDRGGGRHPVLSIGFDADTVKIRRTTRTLQMRQLRNRATMINIVHRVFQDRLRWCNSATLCRCSLIVLSTLGGAVLASAACAASNIRVSPILSASGSRSALFGAEPAADTRFSCRSDRECPGRRPPGAPDRDARPFEGTLGRPCGYRVRFTPQGERRVRVCY